MGLTDPRQTSRSDRQPELIGIRLAGFESSAYIEILFTSGLRVHLRDCRAFRLAPHLMSDLTSRTPGTEAPATAAARAANAALLGRNAKTRSATRSNHAAETNRGYSTAMGRGLELAVTLLVMVGVGLFVDNLAGTAPLFVIIFSILGFAGITVKLYLGYDLEMRKHEEGAIWNRQGEAS